MIKYSAKNVGWNTTSPTQANTVLKESSWANLRDAARCQIPQAAMTTLELTH